ncbi:hypothetical protein OU997_00175 [Pseudomonas sp. SL4(2022)]|uniref:hypothetical protein n=1 Tax=Pseudomonas sp. SL4(2022) TaxID=2994661 RepID=UPI00226FE3C3|nr:hypothetical protein [Pseudomonas sp. SL4(2022)]WAC44657.1 hypothetical protein OU997_00175 [Pseudomonas sp. SL4(2022)]
MPDILMPLAAALCRISGRLSGYAGGVISPCARPFLTGFGGISPFVSGENEKTGAWPVLSNAGLISY